MNLNKEAILNEYLKLPDWQKALISFVVVALLAGLYVYLIYMPLLQDLEQKEKKLAKLLSSVSQVKAVAETLPKFEAENKKVEEQLKNALTQLPSSDELPQLMRDMENIGNEAGIVFETLKIEKERPKEFYAEVPISLRLLGGYHDIAMFFDRLSQLPRIINVSNLDFGSPKDVEGKMLLGIGCVATTYKFIEKK